MNSSAIPTLKKQDWFHSDGFPIAIERRDPQEPFGLHRHEFSEIVIITGGRGVHITGEDSYDLATGDTFVIGGDRPHDYLNMDKLSLINILFDPTELPTSFGDLQSLPGYHALFTLEPAWRKRHMFSSRLQLTPAELIDTLQIVDELECELTQREAGFEVMALASMLRMLAFLSRCYSNSMSPESKKLLRVAESISHIQRNYQCSIRLEELIEISGMSRRTFIRAFEDAMGVPPIKYLIQLRLAKACQLLRRTDSSITDIAFESGFSDSNYFSRQFRDSFGVSPRDYRQRS